MIKLKNVIGSKEASKELIIGKDTVYIHTNIRPYEDKNDEKSNLYIYDEVQMSLHEYLEMKEKELDMLSNTQSSNEDLLQEIILEMYS